MTLSRWSDIPPIAFWLGLFGLVPFVAFTGSLLLDAFVDPKLARLALIGYGAVILSFLGGIHWGVAVAKENAANEQARWYVLSVVPSLLGWVALLLPPVSALIVLLVSFFAMAAIDMAASQAGQLPPWYPKLRWTLTLVVATCLFIAAFSLPTST